MAVEKWRRRGVFATSVAIKNAGGSGGFRSLQGLINNSNGGTFTTGVAAGTLCLTLDGTSVAGTQALLDMSPHRMRLPARAALVGTASMGFTNVGGGGGSEGQVSFGYDGASAQMGVIVGGTVFVLNWATAGGAVSAIASPAGAA